LDFGILHRDYDDGLNQVSGDRPNFFSDERMRQAVAKCIDRSSVAVGSTLNASAVMNTYLPITHSLYPDDVVLPEYDPAGAAALLDQMGWLLGEDGLRYATGVPFVIDGTPLQFTLVTSLDQWHKDMAKDIKTYLAACNIHVEVQTYTLEALFAPGPDGPLFGRQFDLGLFSWSFTGHPACYLYLSDAIPGEDLAKFPFSWGGWNLTGWHNPEYDVACKLARNALPGQDDYGTNHHIAQRIFAQELPVIPLFSKQEIFASRPDLCGMEFGDISQSFWNLESYGYAELCH
jgi:peptide/nickel transport system substrate-binding protein